MLPIAQKLCVGAKVICVRCINWSYKNFIQVRAFESSLSLNLCMLGNCSCFCCLLLTFFKVNFFKEFSSGTQSKCLTVWIQIRTDDLSGLIWVQTVCKGYQQKTKAATSKERVRTQLVCSRLLTFFSKLTFFKEFS